MKKMIGLAVVAIMMIAVSASAVPTTDASKKGFDIQKNGLSYHDEKVGTGTTAEPGKVVTVNYTGWLYNDKTKGKKFDSSFDHGKPFIFPLGAGRVIRGWDEGVAGMKVGGKRTLIIPPALGYGAHGAGSDIPPNAVLMFDVELLKVE